RLLSSCSGAWHAHVPRATCPASGWWKKMVMLSTAFVAADLQDRRAAEVASHAAAAPTGKEVANVSSVVGEFVTETFDYDGGRQVTVYVPPDPPEAVVFAGDGQVLSQWGGVLEAADAPSTLIVGVHRPADETLRLHEYSPR